MKFGFAIIPALMASVIISCAKPDVVYGPDEQPQKGTAETADMDVSVVSQGDFIDAAAPDGQLCLVQREASTGKVNLYFSSKAEAVAGEGRATASFEDIICPEDGTACYFSAKYPASKSDNASGNYLFINIPPEQTPSATSPDPAAVIYAGISRNKFETLPSELSFELSPLAAYGKLSVSGLNLEEGEILYSVRISLEGVQLAGSTRFNIVSSDAEYDSPGSASSISIRTSGLGIDEGKLDLHFACKPFEVEAGETIGLRFETDRRSFSAEIVPDKAMGFLAGRTAELEITVNPAAGEGQDPGDMIVPETGYTVTGSTWYVSVDGDDNNSGTSPSDAFKSFNKVLTKIGPGDQVRIMPGTYEAKAWEGHMDLKKEHSGTPGNYISFVAHDPNDRPVLHAGGKGVWQSIKINASYIVIDGLEICGDNQKISLQEAYDFAKKYYDTGSCDWGVAAIYNTNGISVGEGGEKTGVPNHVIIRNCIIHDMPGGGAGSQQGDYITIEYNTIYNCSWFTMYACSGISYLNPIMTDDYDGFKMIVRGNKIFNCRTDVPWARRGKSFSYSDGNGIIIDINLTPDGSGPAKNQGPYKGKTLVMNNVSVNNGGSGIHAFKAGHVYIVGNTAYHNGINYDGSYGEIWCNQGSDVHIYNNIMYARPNGPCNLGSGAEYTNNVYFGGKVNIKGTGDLVADPLFVNLSTDIFEADFHLTADSPAIGYGNATMEYLPAFDHDFHSRQERIDCGAYQYIGK